MCPYISMIKKVAVSVPEIRRYLHAPIEFANNVRIIERCRRVVSIRKREKTRSAMSKYNRDGQRNRYLLFSGVCELIFSSAIVTLLDACLCP